MTELPVERLHSTPIPGEEGLVDLVVIFKDPETGVEWEEFYPRMRCTADGVDEDGRYRYTLSRALTPTQQSAWDLFLGRDE